MYSASVRIIEWFGCKFDMGIGQEEGEERRFHTDTWFCCVGAHSLLAL